MQIKSVKSVKIGYWPLAVCLFQLFTRDVIADAVAEDDDVVVDDEFAGYG